MSHVLKTSDGRYYCAAIDGRAVWSKHQSAACRFDTSGSARTTLRAILATSNGAEAQEARPVLLCGWRTIKGAAASKEQS